MSLSREAHRRQTLHVHPGLRVTGDCDSRDLELMVTLEVGRAGASLKGVRIDYRHDGRNYSLKGWFGMNACGTKYNGLEPETCDTVVPAPPGVEL